MNVVEFKREEWRDGLATLKNIVARLESGDIPPIVIGALVLYDEQGGLATFGIGPKAEDLQIIAMLDMGKMQVMDAMLSSGE